MNSTINTVYKRPTSVFTISAQNEENYAVRNKHLLIVIFLWMIVAFVAASRTEYSTSLAGILYSVLYFIRIF